MDKQGNLLHLQQTPAAIVVMQLAAEPADSAVGLLLVLAGLPVYLLWLRQRAPHRPAPHRPAPHRPAPHPPARGEAP